MERFIAWWVEGLQCFVPNWLLRGKSQLRPAVRVVPRAENFVLYAVDGMGHPMGRELEVSQYGGPQSVATWLASINTVRPVVVLEIPEALILTSQLIVPMARPDEIRAMLEFDIDRQTPFPRDEVYFDHLVGDLGADGMHLCTLNIVLKEPLDRMLAKLSQLSLDVSLFDRAEQPYPHLALDLLRKDASAAARFRFPRYRRLAWSLGSITGVAFLLALLVGGRNGEVEQLEAREQAARAQAESVMQLRDRRDAMRANHASLDALSSSALDPLEVLNEITRLLPDHSWLDRFDMKGANVVIVGESANASPLIQLFQDSPLVDDVKFISPVVNDPRTSRDRFTISMLFSNGKMP